MLISVLSVYFSVLVSILGNIALVALLEQEIRNKRVHVYRILLIFLSRVECTNAEDISGDIYNIVA